MHSVSPLDANYIAVHMVALVAGKICGFISNMQFATALSGKDCKLNIKVTESKHGDTNDNRRSAKASYQKEIMGSILCPAE